MTNLEFNTKYGIVKELQSYTLYPEGTLKECKLNNYIEINTPYGNFVPQYGQNETRKKDFCSLSFFKNGNLKNISLHQQTEVATPIGIIPAEYITFYENGALKRLFPLNGRLSEYWSEDDEFELAKDISFQFPFASFSKKVIGIQFYESSKVKSITFWPREIVDIPTSQGIISTRIGLSLYESGAIKSIEPKIPTILDTPIGKITSYDINPIGVNGDVNSLCFTEDGKIKSLLAFSNKVKIVNSKGKERIYSPTMGQIPLIGQVLNYDGAEDLEDIQPLRIEFTEDTVIFNSRDKYKINEHTFVIARILNKNKSGCSSCASCNSSCC